MTKEQLTNRILSSEAGIDSQAFRTGALRAAIQQHLRHDRHVKSIRNGRYGEGDMGVTILELK